MFKSEQSFIWKTKINQTTLKQSFDSTDSEGTLCEIEDNYLLHLLFYPSIIMGIKCVLISSAGIIICRGLTESLLCSSDQTLNWHWTAEWLPPVSAARRRVCHSEASFASCAELKVSFSKAAELRSQRDLCLAPCDAACGSTHVTSAVQKKAGFVHPRWDSSKS